MFNDREKTSSKVQITTQTLMMMVSANSNIHFLNYSACISILKSSSYVHT